MSDSISHLSHLDDDGRARMVDVSDKVTTARVATAAGMLTTTPEVIELVRGDSLPKADVLATARVAGITGAKRTWELIPLAHQLAISSVRVSFVLEYSSIGIEAVVKTRGQTGVEMEALTAVAVAGLTLHDMIKAVDPSATLGEIRLLSKTGGKSGHWIRDATLPDLEGAVPEGAAPATTSPDIRPLSRTAAVIVSSTGVAAGIREDATGPMIVEWLTRRGFSVDALRVAADAHVAPAIAEALASGPTVLITTGGTGVSPTDATPEATRVVLTSELPGIAEAIRARGRDATPTASLSRGLAGVAGQTIIINLPGSVGGVKDGLAVLEGILDHLIKQVTGLADHPRSADHG